MSTPETDMPLKSEETKSFGLKILMYAGLGSSAILASGITMDVIAVVDKNIHLGEAGITLTGIGAWLTQDIIRIIRNAEETSSPEEDTLVFKNRDNPLI